MSRHAIESPLLDRMEAATFLGVRSSAFALIQHKIPCIRVSKRKKYLVEDLQNYIRSQKDESCLERAARYTKGRTRPIINTASALMDKSLEEVLGLRT